jgi:tetratricopeptide (TPR) repeat protein
MAPERRRHLHEAAASVLQAMGPWRDVAGQVGWHRWQAGQPGRAVEALLDGADAARIGGRLDEALVLLDHAQRAVSASDPAAEEAAARARLAWLRGWTLESQGHPDAAAEALGQAVALAEVAEDRDAVMAARRARAGFLRRRGDVDGAMRCVLAAHLDAGEASTTSRAHIGALYLELGLVHRAVGDRAASRDALRQALTRIPEDEPLHGDALYFLALQALDEDDLDAGVAYAQRAMGAYGRLGMMGGIGAVHDVLATVARRRGHLEEAETQLRAAASLHVASLDRAVGLANLGLVRIALGEHAAAAEALWEALERFRRIRFARMEALAHAALLGPLAALGRWDGLLYHLEAAADQVGPDLVDPDVADVVLAAAERMRAEGRERLADEALTVAASLIGPDDGARRARLVALRASR